MRVLLGYMDGIMGMGGNSEQIGIKKPLSWRAERCGMGGRGIAMDKICYKLAFA
jgi:hypothetical protein